MQEYKKIKVLYDIEEMERFWNDLDMVLDRLCVVGDLNEWVRESAQENITGTFEIQGEMGIETDYA